MSRHHITPPAIYTPPPPKPKEARRRRSVGYASAAEGMGEAGETSETPQARALPQHQRPVEAAERRIPSPNGKLSDDMLKAMIEMQEKEGGQGTT